MKRIAIVGPESTGKSTLSKQLALHYNTVWAPEFARDYLTSLNRNYIYDDLLTIAQNQLLLEEKVSNTTGKMVFCDTNLLVIKIWSLHRYGKVDQWIEQQLQNHKYDMQLLCNIDFPWEEDPLREHPHLRQFFFDWYKKELDDAGANYKIISGTGASRFHNAVEIIDSQLLKA